MKAGRKWIVLASWLSVGLLLAAARAADKDPPENRGAVDVTVRAVEGTPQRGYRLILESKARPARFLTIYVGGNEAQAIWMGLRRVKMPRPLTHDLLHRTIQALGATVEQIEVTKLENGTFFAEVTFSLNNKRTQIDARPSDSIALALRAGCPIRVSRTVLRKAGTDKPDEPPDEPKPKPEPPVDAV
jgi:bifunctional DNase/RNase